MRLLVVTNMYPTNETPSSGTFVQQQVNGLREIGLKVKVVHVQRVSKGMAAYWDLGRSLRSALSEFQADLVHAMYGGVMADITVRKVQDRPTVVSFCGSELLGEQLSSPIRRLAAQCGVLASHRAARKASGIVVKSNSLKEALPSSIDSNKVRVIPNGIDLKRFKPLDQKKCRELLGWHSDRFHVLFTNNNHNPVKRPELAKAAVDAARHCGIPAEMHHLSGVVHRDVPIWLNASDVLLVTSVHEGSPNIVKEALACDLPIISVDVGDVRERIHAVAGCHLARPDASDLADKLCHVHVGSRRIAGRDQVAELSLESISRRLKQFYQDLL